MATDVQISSFHLHFLLRMAILGPVGICRQWDGTFGLLQTLDISPALGSLSATSTPTVFPTSWACPVTSLGIASGTVTGRSGLPDLRST